MTSNSVLGGWLQMGPSVVDLHRSIPDLARLIRNRICRKMPRGFPLIGYAAKNGVGFPLRQISAACGALSSDLWRFATRIDPWMLEPTLRRSASAHGRCSLGGAA